MLIFDGHLDLAMNAIEWNRDYTRPLAEVRQREQGLTDKRDRGQNVLTLGEMRRGQIGVCIATQIARYVAPDNPLPGWNSPEIAWAVTQAQLAWYRAMEEAGQMVQIVDRQGLNRMVELWKNDPPPDAPIGYILSLEGAGLDSHAGAPGTGLRRRLAGRRTRPLRPRPLLSGDRRQRRTDAAGTRTAARDAPSGHRAGCHPPDR